MLSSNPSTEVFPKYVITKPISVYYFCLADSLNLTNNRVEGGICETRALILGKFCDNFGLVLPADAILFERTDVLTYFGEL